MYNINLCHGRDPCYLGFVPTSTADSTRINRTKKVVDEEEGLGVDEIKENDYPPHCQCKHSRHWCDVHIPVSPRQQPSAPTQHRPNDRSRRRQI